MNWAQAVALTVGCSSFNQPPSQALLFPFVVLVLRFSSQLTKSKQPRNTEMEEMLQGKAEMVVQSPATKLLTSMPLAS